MNLKSRLRACLNSGQDFERRKILKWVNQDIPKGATILDVGCGHGTRLKPLLELGYRAVGIEINPTSRAGLSADGITALAPEEFFQKPVQADAILFGHIIAFYTPEALLELMNSYLKYLKPGGKLFIATPLMSNHFHADFYQIKPYQPNSLLQVFGGNATQVSRHSPFRLKLNRLWYRRAPFLLTRIAAIHFPSLLGYCVHGINVFMKTFFILSFGTFGSKDGWVGEFERV